MDDYIEPAEVDYDLNIACGAIGVPDDCASAKRFRQRFTPGRVRMYVIEAHERQLLEDRIEELEKDLRMSKAHHRHVISIFLNPDALKAAGDGIRRHRCLPRNAKF